MPAGQPGPGAACVRGDKEEDCLLVDSEGQGREFLVAVSGIYSYGSKKERELEKRVTYLQEELKVAREHNNSNKGTPVKAGLQRGGRQGGAARGGGNVRGGHTGGREGPSIEQKLAW